MAARRNVSTEIISTSRGLRATSRSGEIARREIQRGRADTAEQGVEEHASPETILHPLRLDVPGLVPALADVEHAGRTGAVGLHAQGAAHRLSARQGVRVVEGVPAQRRGRAVDVAFKGEQPSTLAGACAGEVVVGARAPIYILILLTACEEDGEEQKNCGQSGYQRSRRILR